MFKSLRIFPSCTLIPYDVDTEKISIGLKCVAESLLVEPWRYVAHIEGHGRVGGHLSMDFIKHTFGLTFLDDTIEN